MPWLVTLETETEDTNDRYDFDSAFDIGRELHGDAWGVGSSVVLRAESQGGGEGGALTSIPSAHQASADCAE